MKTLIFRCQGVKAYLHDELAHILCELEVRKAKVFEGWTRITVCYQVICINLHIKNIPIIG